MYKEKLNNINMIEIEDKELMETNGGGVGCLVVVAIVLIAGGGLGIGIYNGYKDAEAEDKKD